MREKLIELLSVVTCPNKICNFCEHFENGVACEKHRNEVIADHLVANGVTIQQWISVKDRLPKEEGLYLVSVVNDHERRYSKTAWYHGHGNWFVHQKVTHWQCLPQPPKGE